MEKYLIFVQERNHFIRTERLIALMNKKNQEEIENLEDVLGRKITINLYNLLENLLIEYSSSRILLILEGVCFILTIF